MISRSIETSRGVRGKRGTGAHGKPSETQTRTRQRLSAGWNWQERAILRFQRRQVEEIAALQTEFARRIQLLTGRSIEPYTIYVNSEERHAVVTIDGVTFRLRGNDLALLRPCAYCAVGQFESPPLHTTMDFGHALSVWQPRHRDCETSDPDNWLDSED
jgi:hypothetical protein